VISKQFQTSFVSFKQKGSNALFQKQNRVFKNHLIWNHSKKCMFCFRKQRPSKDLAFKTCIDFNPFQKSELSWISKVLQIAPSFSSKISKLLVLKSFGICKTFSSKWFQTPCTHYFETSFVQRSLFGKVYKMVWIVRLPLQKAQMFLKILSKEVWKAKSF